MSSLCQQLSLGAVSPQPAAWLSTFHFQFVFLHLLTRMWVGVFVGIDTTHWMSHGSDARVRELVVVQPGLVTWAI